MHTIQKNIRLRKLFHCLTAQLRIAMIAARGRKLESFKVEWSGVVGRKGNQAIFE